jgi:hypothetical protein
MDCYLINNEVNVCASILYDLKFLYNNEEIVGFYDTLMDAMDEQEFLIEIHTNKLLALCNSHIEIIRRIKFVLNKTKISRSLFFLTADVIHKMSEIPLSAEKEMALTHELSKI